LGGVNDRNSVLGDSIDFSADRHVYIEAAMNDD